MICGTGHEKESQRYMDDGKTYDHEIVEALFPYLKWIIFIMMLSRIPLIIASYWNMGVTKYYLYH